MQTWDATDRPGSGPSGSRLFPVHQRSKGARAEYTVKSRGATYLNVMI
jgi:hypothetical protein